MYYTPTFGTTEWILDNCTSLGMNPTGLFAMLIFMAILFIVCFYGWVFTYDTMTKMKKYLTEKKQLQQYEDWKQNGCK